MHIPYFLTNEFYTTACKNRNHFHLGGMRLVPPFLVHTEIGSIYFLGWYMEYYLFFSENYDFFYNYIDSQLSNMDHGHASTSNLFTAKHPYTALDVYQETRGKQIYGFSEKDKERVVSLLKMREKEGYNSLAFIKPCISKPIF